MDHLFIIGVHMCVDDTIIFGTTYINKFDVAYIHSENGTYNICDNDV